MTSTRPRPGGPRRYLAMGWLSAICALSSGCAVEDAAPDTEAVALWSQPEDAPSRVFRPQDVKVGAPTTVWVADDVYGAVFRLSPGLKSYGMFGWGDKEPVEVLKPVRLAVEPNIGVFVYDDSTRHVDLYTADGVHLRAFEPGFRPSMMAITHDPLGLTFAYVETVADSARRLMVVRTDMTGAVADTLVSRTAGPGTLRNLSIVPGALAAAPSESGLWLWARTATDTVFEVTSRGIERQLVLPLEDGQAIGILYDLDEKLLWAVLRQEPPGGLRYRAYDVAEAGVLNGDSVFLGERVTPVGFTAHAARAGLAYGLRPHPEGGFLAAAYDLRVGALRARSSRLAPTNWGQ